MNSTRLATMALVGAAAVAAQGPPPHGPGGPFGPMFRGPMGPPKVVTGAPYSGTEQVQMQQTLADGNQIQHTDSGKVYRDSQGRVRTEMTRGTHTMITIFDPVAGYVAHLDPTKQTATKMTLPSNPPSHPAPPNPPQISKQDIGTETMSGLTATGTRITETIPAGAFGNQQPIQTVREVWVSTALSVPVLVKTTDPRFGTSTIQLTDITRSEPDPALFQIPAGWTVTTRQPPAAGGPGPEE